MKLKIIHETTYNFTSEVFLEPHYFRFKPKTTPHINVSGFKIKIKPNPVGLSSQVDAENNQVDFAWFDGLHSKLYVRAESFVDIKDYNPFNFLIYPIAFNTLPINYPDSKKRVLKAALTPEKLSEELNEYAEKIIHASQSNILKFITDLTIQIHNDFSIEYRHFGEPLDPNETFTFKKGSCRDITWMQIHVLRSFGIASRFVSGYFYIDSDQSDYELHAWVEVFIPGAGWLGFDPSHGIIASRQHIPVTSSVNFTETMPVTGTVRGDATSHLSTDLSIEMID